MELEPLPRKLAAILYADVAGYSRLTGADEDTTHRRLAEYLDQIAVTIERHGGRVMHYAGDAVLAMFEAVVDALSCAAQIQNELRSRNEDLPDERKVQFRIGVNLGDVIEDRGDIYGDGVNVAARLEGLAEPGGICISESVHTAVGNKLPFDYEFLGEQEVKNIAKPVRAYYARLTPDAVLPEPRGAPRKRKQMHWPIVAAAIVLLVALGGVLTWLKPWEPREEPASIERMAFPLPEKPSIAVLPFTNMSGDPEQEYFANGITESVVTELSRFQNLFVIARNSTRSYKSNSREARQVSEAMGVRYVLEGNVQRSKDRVRINVQLVDALTGRHLWGERYDKALIDLFAVQDEVTREIVATLATEDGRLAKAWQERTARKGTESLNAYELDLRGWKAYGPWTKDAFERAEELFEKAIAADPDYARPYANLALITVWQVYSNFIPEESLERAVELAKESIARDDGEAWGHWALGAAYLKLGSHERAVAEYERALQLNSNDADVLAESAWPLSYAGRPDEGIENARSAMRLNPRYPDWYLWALGVASYDARRYEEAVTALENRKNPNLKSNLYLAAAYAQLGRQNEAQAMVEKILEDNPESSIERWGKAQPYQNEAALNHYIDGLRKAGLPE